MVGARHASRYGPSECHWPAHSRTQCGGRSAGCWRWHARALASSNPSRRWRCCHDRPGRHGRRRVAVGSDGHVQSPPAGSGRESSLATCNVWTTAGAGLPSTTGGPAIANDEAESGSPVVLFGGIGNELKMWLWSAQGWMLAHPSATPPGRSDAALAYDPTTHDLLLFGGVLPPVGLPTTRGHGTAAPGRESVSRARGPPADRRPA